MSTSDVFVTSEILFTVVISYDIDLSRQNFVVFIQIIVVKRPNIDAHRNY